MKKILIILAAAAAFLTIGTIEAAAQSGISGIVTDNTGDPLAGAVLVDSAKSIYAVTNENGAFSLNAKEGAVITVSYLGFDDYILTVGKASVYTVAMKPSAATMLEETVVIGYGTTTKKELTGSVASINADALDRGAYTDVAGMIQGKVAGLSITNPNGDDPNGGFEILLRGTNTLSAGQGPLIIVDGVVGADIRTVNFQEVESFDVLKDGSAAAIYGTRGTNGVIIITTKRAKAGRTSVEYDGQVSVQTLRSRAVPMSAAEFTKTVNEYKPDASGSLYGADTDWFDEVTRTPFSHRHNLAISGGSEKFSHRTVLSANLHQGMLKNNYSNRYLAKTNIHQETLEGWLTLDYNLSYNRRQYSGTRSGIFRQAFLHNPTEPIYDQTDEKNGGYYTIESMDYYNPVAMLNERSNDSHIDKIGANARATVNILAVEGLKWDNFFSYETEWYESNDYKTRYYPGETGLNGSAEISNSRMQDIQFESTIQYNRKFGKHGVQALLGYTFQEMQENSSYMYNYGFDSDFFKTNNMTAGAALKTGNASMDSYREGSRYIAFFGRAIYNYADRYMISVSLRRDGSSRFGANNKWGWFPAVSAGWRISQEEWMKNVTWLDELKLRAGYGETGNQDFSNYKSLFLVKTSGSFYYNGQWSNAYAPASNANPDLAWEKKAEVNVGVDFSMFDGRFTGAIDYYYRKTTNLLYNYSVPVPPYDYEEYFTNVGAISNTGIELTLGGIPVKTKIFEWDTSLVLAHNENKLISFTNEEFQGQEYRVGWLNTPLGAYSQRLVENEAIGTFYGPEFKDLNAIGAIRLVQNRESDWVKLGNAYPWLTMGWSNSFKIQNFTLGMTWRGSFGGKVFNQMRGVYQNISELGLKNVLASWLEVPELLGKVTYCSMYLEDATYLKLDNVSLAYNFKFDNNYVKALSLYLTGQNLLTITKYTGVDPEVSLTGLAPGIEGLSYYPRTRTFTLGAKLTF